jgi:hypothetical protein
LSFCPVAEWKSSQCFLASSFARTRQIFHKPQPVGRALAAELYDVHSPTDKVQAQSAWPYLLKWPPSEFARVNRRASVTKKYFESAFNFFALPAAPRSSKVHGDRLAWAIAVGVPHDVGQSFIDRASDRSGLGYRESQVFSQALNCPAHYREQSGTAVYR